MHKEKNQRENKTIFQVFQDVFRDNPTDGINNAVFSEMYEREQWVLQHGGQSKGR